LHKPEFRFFLSKFQEIDPKFPGTPLAYFRTGQIRAMLIQNAIYRSTAIPAAAKSLDAAVLRGKAIAANLANVTTPGYERIEVAFESALRAELNKIQEKGGKADWDPAAAREVFERVKPVAYRPQDTVRPGGINNVDVDVEAAKLAENQILFQYGVKFVQESKGLLESAIRGEAG
jgi:flagellar basal-body rod protein FlgB